MGQIDHRFDDALEPLGVAAGGFLLLVGLGTLAGTPWTTASSGLAAGITVLGALATMAVGVGLAYLSWTSR